MTKPKIYTRLAALVFIGGCAAPLPQYGGPVVYRLDRQAMQLAWDKANPSNPGSKAPRGFAFPPKKGKPCVIFILKHLADSPDMRHEEKHCILGRFHD